MTVRFVECEFCHTINDFGVMHMCPLCRKVICRRCKHEGPLVTGCCAKRTPCEGKQAPPSPSKSS